MKSKPLPKGWPVRFKIYDRNVKKYISSLAENDNITDVAWWADPKTGEGFILIEGFVSGDAAKGLSIVALENPEVCLLQLPPDNKFIPKIRKCVFSGFLDPTEIIHDSGYYGNPTCPY